MNIRTFIKDDKAALNRFVATEPEGRYEYEWGRNVQQQTGRTRRPFQLAGRFSVALRKMRGGNRDFADDPDTMSGLDKSIDIMAFSLSIPLNEIYRGLTLKPAAFKV